MENYFNQNLKLMRETCGFSQEELSEKLGLKRAAISTYERGANVPKFDTLIKLRMLFEIGLDDMIFTRLGVELEFKPINKLRDGKDVKTGESNCTICDVSGCVPQEKICLLGRDFKTCKIYKAENTCNICGHYR